MSSLVILSEAKDLARSWIAPQRDDGLIAMSVDTSIEPCLRGSSELQERIMECGGYTYILTNRAHTVLYVGVTANLHKRLAEHESRLVPGFTAKYNVHKLVYYERLERIEDAITREKQIKGKTRAKKLALIASMNPDWQDLSRQ